VRSDIGAHLDGFIAVTAHTGLVTEGGAFDQPLEDDTSAAGAASADATKADVVTAAHVCAELALRLVKPGGTNGAVTEAWGRVAEHFGVNLCQGVLSHQLKQFVIDGSKVIIARPVKEDEQMVEDVTFEPNEVYAIDVAVSSGDGKPKEMGNRTTVFKRLVENKVAMKMEASRALLRMVQEKFPTLPFSLRSFSDPRQARMGVVECVKHDLLAPYPTLREKEGDVTAHFKFTAMLLPSGTLKATGLALPPNLRSAKLDTLPEDLKAVLETAAFASKNKKKRKNRKRGGKGDEAEADE
jgi:curved DNA binding protein